MNDQNFELSLYKTTSWSGLDSDTYHVLLSVKDVQDQQRQGDEKHPAVECHQVHLSQYLVLAILHRGGGHDGFL